MKPLTQRAKDKFTINSDDECDYGVVEIIRNENGTFTMQDTYCEVYQNTFTYAELIGICDQIKEWTNRTA